MTDNSRVITAEISTAMAVASGAFADCSKTSLPVPANRMSGEGLAGCVLRNRSLMRLARSADGISSARALVAPILTEALRLSTDYEMFLELAQAGIKLLEVEE
ncbi:MAG: hypothetical protein PHV78_01355 [Patescibacteria group bacterium]|nr:hypothetical protein [Patescibacteria group bacterium]MDD5121197.1 hypothetical protein [Patescibacteria group bacterium]MDD5395884.1 hypothetical protein [Patescibacteria group bacterium]